MKVTLQGFDPDLGRRFAEENGGVMFLRGKQLQAKPIETMPLGLDAQQQHDWLKANPGAKDPTVPDEE